MNSLSWKTTVAGILTGIGGPLAASGTGIYKITGIILVAIGPVLLGLSARDNNKTSEQVGAK